MTKIVTKKINAKRVLYAICFLILMLIDWTRGSQVGSTWAWTVNMTGIVVAIMLCSVYPKEAFKKPIYGIYSLICLIAIPVSYIWWNGNQEAIYRDKLLTAVINIWLLGIFVIRQGLTLYSKRKTWSMQKLIDHMKKNILEWLAMLVLLFAFLSVNEDVWPLWYMVMFALLYGSPFTKTDMDCLQQGMLDGIIAGFFLLQGAAFVFRPFDSGHHRYNGIYANCNINALFYSVVFLAILMKLYHSRKQKKAIGWRIFWYVLAGGVLGFVVLTISKTAWLSLICVGICYIVMADLFLLKKKAFQESLLIIGMILIMLVSIPIDYFLARYLPPVFHHPVWYEGEYSLDRVHSFDPWDSEKYISWDEMKAAITERIIPYLPSALRMNVQAAEDDLLYSEIQEYRGEHGEYDSAIGRLYMWNYYLKNGTIFGHSNVDGHIIGLPCYVWHAQNVYIQYWYYYGIVVGIAFLIYLFAMVTKATRMLLKRNDDSLVVLLGVCLFMIYGLLEAVWYPGQMLFFSIWFLLLFIREKERN